MKIVVKVYDGEYLVDGVYLQDVKQAASLLAKQFTRVGEPIDYDLDVVVCTDRECLNQASMLVMECMSISTISVVVHR